MLGLFWSFLQPLAMLAVLYVFFRGRVGEGISNYAVFLLIGIVHFTHFSKTTSSAMRVLHHMRGLVTNVIFPKELLVFSSALSDAPEFLLSIPIVLATAWAMGTPIGGALLLLPVVLLLQFMLVLWVSLLLSALYIFVRDLDHIYEVALRILFFITPIMYDMSFLGATSRRIALLNPLTTTIGFSRTIILEGRAPNLGSLAGALLLNILLTALALFIFRRAEPALVEHL